MTTLNSKNVQALQVKLNALLAAFAEENGLISGSTEIRFNEKGMNVKVAMSTKESNPTGTDPRFLKDLRARGWQHGLMEAMVGTVISSISKGEQVKLQFQGMRASKIVMLNLADGKQYAYNAEQMAPRVISAHAV